MNQQSVLEVCAGSVESVRAAYEGGAQRVELCSALSEDGLTPSVGMIRYACSLPNLKVHVLIRPRSGDFVYTETEVACMLEDIRMARMLGADGVVIGALTGEGDIDMPTCRLLVEAADGMQITFHRAFDVCREPFAALEQIIELKCDRLLTSGQAQTAEQGMDMIASLVKQAGSRLIIMPGAGVGPANASHILQTTGAREIHASARSQRLFGRLETDSRLVRQIAESIS